MTVKMIQTRLLDLMEQRRWSKYDLAKESGLPVNTVYKIFKRKTYPKLDTIVKLCEALGISVGEFFAFDMKHTDGHLTDKDVILVDIAHVLTERQQEKLIDYAAGMKGASEAG